MASLSPERALRLVLTAVGLVSLFAVYPLMHVWPDGWRWQPYNPAYEHMIVAVYATLGVFLLRAVRRPDPHRSLILFAGWSILLHGGVMALDAVRTPGEREHLVGDVPALILGGALLVLLAPRPGMRR
jgi:hypothetical protein